MKEQEKWKKDEKIVYREEELGNVERKSDEHFRQLRSKGKMEEGNELSIKGQERKMRREWKYK